MEADQSGECSAECYLTCLCVCGRACVRVHVFVRMHTCTCVFIPAGTCRIKGKGIDVEGEGMRSSWVSCLASIDCNLIPG